MQYPHLSKAFALQLSSNIKNNLCKGSAADDISPNHHKLLTTAVSEAKGWYCPPPAWTRMLFIIPYVLLTQFPRCLLKYSLDGPSLPCSPKVNIHDKWLSNSIVYTIRTALSILHFQTLQRLVWCLERASVWLLAHKGDPRMTWPRDTPPTVMCCFSLLLSSTLNAWWKYVKAELSKQLTKYFLTWGVHDLFTILSWLLQFSRAACWT